nr:M48 family metalloprotease [Pseudohoeflea sp. DP4N28-3]
MAAIGLTLALAGCQTLGVDVYKPDVSPSASPQTAERAGSADPRTKIGASEHPRIVASYGGEYRDQRTEKLLARIIGKLTVVSENPQQAYRVTVLNSPAVNAFALPGGYVYVTRGLLALANDASEVAAVIAHEMGHVTGNHGIERRQREREEALAERMAASAMEKGLAAREELAQSKLRLAAFSRNQELAADAIGVRMLGEAGYDTYAAARFLNSMDAYSRFSAVDPTSDQSLDFLSSHPNAPQRLELVKQHARAFGPEGTTEPGRDFYLDGIDGLLFGDSPQEGYVRGTAFLHPVLGIRFEVPSGFRIDNKADAVLATGPDDLAVRFDGVSENSRRSLSDYMASGWVTGLIAGSIRETRLGGFEAATARARADRWDFDITIVKVDNRIYRFLTAAPLNSPHLEPTAAKLRDSFRKLTAGEAKSLQPLRIRIVTARARDTLTSMAAKMRGTDRKQELFQLLNAIGPGAGIEPGRRYKIVTD